MKRIKIIHIITKLELGGAQQNTIYTTANLSTDIFDAKLITGPGGILDDKAKSTFKNNIIFVKSLIREISPFKDLMALIELIKILRKEKPDIIHTHSSKAGIIGRIAGFITGIKIIIHTYHGFGFHDFQNIFIKKFYIFLERVTSKITDAIIFVSKANMETAKRYAIGNNKKYHIIRSGIKLSEFSKQKDKSFAKKFFDNINNDSKVIVTVANLKPQKNPKDFFEIAESVINDFSDVFFIYAGGGEKKIEDYYKDLIIKKGIEKRCIITGWIDNVKEVYKAADIFLLTSLWEGLPRSLVEAMASGVVPVCYETDGVSDIIKDGVNGFIVRRLDVPKTIFIIKKLLKDKKLYENLYKNINLIDLSEFDIDFMVKQQERLYLDLIKYKV